MNTKPAPVSEYPRKDGFHGTSFWTGPVGAPGTYVTGFRKRSGASVTYYQATCTCTPYGGAAPERWGHGAMDQVEVDAYEHAAAHVLGH
jgi:hypothetical protein